MCLGHSKMNLLAKTVRPWRRYEKGDWFSSDCIYIYLKFVHLISSGLVYLENALENTHNTKQPLSLFEK